jgi:hypothetical protein
MEFCTWFLSSSAVWCILIIAQSILPSFAPKNVEIHDFVVFLSVGILLCLAVVSCAGLINTLKYKGARLPGPLRYDPKKLPKLIIMSFTWGTNPKVVNDTMWENVKCFLDLNFYNIEYVIVSDFKEVTLDVFPGVQTRSILVPREYKHPKGLMFKARSVGYIQELFKKEKSDDSYVLNLDQGVYVADSSAIAILNCMGAGHDYANGYPYHFNNYNKQTSFAPLVLDIYLNVLCNASNLLADLTGDDQWRATPGGHQLSTVYIFNNMWISLPISFEIMNWFNRDRYSR